MRVQWAASVMALAATAVTVTATPVSVCRDATYDIPAARGALCSGAGAAPAGKACPLKGDVATESCHPYLPSFDGKSCVAKEDAVCEIVNGDTWGCVFPSVGCGNPKPTPAPTTVTPIVIPVATCPEWQYDEGADDIVVSEIFIEEPEPSNPAFAAIFKSESVSWYTQETPVAELYACNEKPTPPPTTEAPTTTPSPTTPEPTTPTPTTPEPTTPTPTTPEPTTPEPTTPAPTTPEPTTPEPTTPEPTTPEPTTPEPTTPEPTTPEPTTPEPTTSEPTTPEPTTPEPTTPEPTIPEPTTPEPLTPEPTTTEPCTIPPYSEPTAPPATTSQPPTTEPTISETATPEPTTPEPSLPEPVERQSSTQISPTPSPTAPETTPWWTETYAPRPTAGPRPPDEPKLPPTTKPEPTPRNPSPANRPESTSAPPALRPSSRVTDDDSETSVSTFSSAENTKISAPGMGMWAPVGAIVVVALAVGVFAAVKHRVNRDDRASGDFHSDVVLTPA